MQIQVESIITALISLAPNHIVTIQKKLEYSVNLLLLETDVQTAVNSIFDKENLNIIQHHRILELAVRGDYTTTYWADASSNALQLITLASGTTNKFLLELLNIIENKTAYKNIYTYISEKIKNDTTLDNPILTVNYTTVTNTILNADTIKTIAMPAAYGKTLWACYKTIDQKLTETDTTGVWIHLLISERRAIIKKWYKRTYLILGELGLNIKGHIKLCQNILKTTTIKTHLNIPLVSMPVKLLNRAKIRIKIRNAKIALNSVLEDMLKLNIKNKKITTPNHHAPNTAPELLITIIAHVLDYKQGGKEKELPNTDEFTVYKLYTAIQKNKRLLEEDDLYTRRINVSIKPKYRYQFRVQKLSGHRPDTRKNKTAIAPNITHAYDASLLINTLQILQKLNIQALCIHDAIGTNIGLIAIVTTVYKIELITTVNEYYKNNRYYPYTDALQEYTLGEIAYPQDILNSTFLFS